MNILGISAHYHDSAAALVRDGRIVCAAQEERFTRKKHDSSLPANAILYCLEEGQVGMDEVHAVAFYEKPITKFTRLLATYSAIAPRGLKTFLMGVPGWLKEKAWVGQAIESFIRTAGYGRVGRFYFPEHHCSHAASAFHPSPFDSAAILTSDGVGEWTTSSIGVGEGSRVELIYEQHFPHSVGLLYSAFTHYTGFKVNSGEYKLMGLAPYGRPVFADKIRDHLVEIKPDGSIHLDMDYFDYLGGLTMTSDRFHDLFGGPPRKPESEIRRRDMDLAASIQVVTEEIMVKTARFVRAATGKRHLCMAGGVALNCVANGKILRERIFDRIWIQPAAGDAGGALGAALYVHHSTAGAERKAADQLPDGMQGGALGPAFPCAKIRAYLDANRIPYQEMEDEERNRFLARSLAEEKVVGFFQGRMEFGPRALGNRSILADARSRRMQSHLNIATKFRESFRPFAPVVLKEDALDYFEVADDSPYMLVVDQVRKDRCFPQPAGEENLGLIEQVNRARSDLPAITHVDYSARVQTVDPVRHPALHALLLAFKRHTGCSVLVNTSFNVRNEPIVCTPEDAFRCFMRTGMDILVLERLVLEKSRMPERPKEDWQSEFGLD